jgi:pyroglutamyl-peptidase
LAAPADSTPDRLLPDGNMTSVLITAFEPYDCWHENSSWLALVELTKTLPGEPRVVTRRYPVDFPQVRERLAVDLAAGYEYALHLGQAPGLARVHLEAIGLNIGGTSQQLPDEFQPLVPDGPVAYQSALPLATWAAKLRAAGIPAQVSYHAGTYLCNATLYLTHHLCRLNDWRTKAAFVHLPLAPEQVLRERKDTAWLPPEMAAQAIRLMLEELR